ncbi:16S rRNA (cytosine967-C5)-methyltransferase [Clostridiales Family XIII bacterium PM5-7]
MDVNRKTAYNTLIEIEKNQSYSNLELNRQIDNYNPDSPSFVRELVYGVIENRVYLDYILDQLVDKGLKSIRKAPLTLLRMGLYQIMFMDSVPEYAAVDQTVKMARRLCYGRDGFINAVLRNFLYKQKNGLIEMPDFNEDPIRYLSIKHSYAPWIAELWVEQYGVERAEELMIASNSKPPLCIRVNLLKTDLKTLEDILISKGFQVRRGTLSRRVLFVKGSNLLDLPEFEQGLFSVQDESSVVSVETLMPKAGDVVLDICAAPGGKTMAAAEMMNNIGEIKAFDIYPHKLELIAKEANRLGHTIITTVEGDGTIFNKNLVETADRVIVDAPCSGLGVIRRKPEIKYRELEDNGRELGEKQLEMLELSSKYVKKGGFLLYSTCTINKIENTDVVSNFLGNHNEYELVKSRQLLPGIDETDGFFICKMRKKNN